VLNAKLGSYGTWSKMAREPLIWLGEADPVESMDQGWDEVLAACAGSWSGRFTVDHFIHPVGAEVCAADSGLDRNPYLRAVF
jgi:hypothetical protein